MSFDSVILLLIHTSHRVDHQSSDELFVLIQLNSLNHFCFDWQGGGFFVCLFLSPDLCSYAENPRSTNSLKTTWHRGISFSVREADRRSAACI